MKTLNVGILIAILRQSWTLIDRYMKKLFIVIMLLMLTVASRAQEVIDYDFDISRPLWGMSVTKDASGLKELKDGCTWSLEVKDFDTAGNMVTFNVYNPDGESVISRTWNNVNIVNLPQSDGCDSYVIAHGEYIYLMVFEMSDKKGAKQWAARLYTDKVN